MASDATSVPKIREKVSVVVAIEFGTSYSGYAFSLQHKYQENPMNVTSPIFSRGGLFPSASTSTVILLNPDESFNSFGYDAEERYNELREDNEHHDYHYFRNFKKILYDPGSLNLEMMLEDSNGRKVKALKVFAMSIKYMRTHLMETLRKRGTLIDVNKVFWVVTVPANDCSRQFLKEAAKMAGISSSSMDVIVEADALSSCFMHLPKDEMIYLTDGPMTGIFTVGNKYAIITIGNDEVSSSAYEVKDSTTLQELDYVIDIGIGGKLVNAAFDKFCITLIGDCFDKFIHQCPDDYIDLHRELDIKKRTLQMGKSGKQGMKVSVELKELYEDEMKVKGNAIKISERISQIKEFDGKVVLNGDRLRLDMEIWKSFFDEACSKSIEHVRNLLQRRPCKDVNTLLLTGDFSVSPMLQEAMTSAFRDKRVIIARKAFDDILLTGAVSFGYNPLTVLSRFSPHLYSFK